MEGFIDIGHISKLHGYKGEVSLFLDVTYPEDYHKIELIFLEMDGIPTPFQVVSLKSMNKGFVVVRLQEISNEHEAKKIVRKRVYMPEQVLSELDENSFYDHEIIGFEVIDSQAGSIGTVSSVIDHSTNPLLQVDYKGKEILIPLNLDLNKKIVRNKRQLFVTLPEGLLNLYLG